MFIGLEAEEYDRLYSDTDLLKRIVRYFVKYKKEMGIVTFVLALSSIVSALVFVFSSFAINTIIVSRNIPNVLFVLFIILILNLLSYIFNYYNWNYSAKA
ncbi:MAG: hypothetical protein ACFFD2_21670, partial [Promethearchaeota archaeon]